MTEVELDKKFHELIADCQKNEKERAELEEKKRQLENELSGLKKYAQELNQEKSKIYGDGQVKKLPKNLGNLTIEIRKKLYKKCVDEILKVLKRKLSKELLDAPIDVPSEGNDEKEKYKPYGFLLSACKIKECFKKNEAMMMKLMKEVVENDKTLSVSDGDFVRKEVSMTLAMLMLLPPLIVCKSEISEAPPKEIFNEIFDTNRHTWDENKDGPPFYIYRPVLVYGNHMHVAVKGFIGNCEKELSAVPTDHPAVKLEESAVKQTHNDGPLETSNHPAVKKPEESAVEQTCDNEGLLETSSTLNTKGKNDGLNETAVDDVIKKASN